MADDVTIAVTGALRSEGLPMEFAVRCAQVAVEAVRGYLWSHLPCSCEDAWTSRALRDPACPVHDYDLELGGDGDGALLTVEQQRERLAMTAVQLQQQYGDEVYQQVFAPAYAALLSRVNTDVEG